jgi:hypothetical protein
MFKRIEATSNSDDAEDDVEVVEAPTQPKHHKYISSTRIGVLTHAMAKKGMPVGSQLRPSPGHKPFKLCAFQVTS